MRINILKFFGLITVCLFFSSIVVAQNRNCATMANLDYRMQQDPTLEQKMSQIEEELQEGIHTMQQNRMTGCSVITIPVVVHVIYSNSNENISDAQILSQIQVLNEDFRRMNTDADDTWSQAADTEIQFCMAIVDPEGNSTNGITRKNSMITSWGTNDNMKRASQGGVDPWDTSQYLNIWVCNIGGGTLGYAQFPGGSASTDGVVISPNFFGSINGGSDFYLTSGFDLGRTTTHEVGHYLNLRHIWGDGDCSNDDYVGDTPNSDAENYGCNIGHVSCGSVDMVQNYMDYSDDACMNLFSIGQKARMRSTLTNYRSSLGSSTACSTCVENNVTISITFDNYPGETSWTLNNAIGDVVASGGLYENQPIGSIINETLCLPDGFYTFTMNDTYGDGICCAYGNGSYEVLNNDCVLLVSGDAFESSETTNLCLGDCPEPTCTDGIRNGDETGIDCGGSICETCLTLGNPDYFVSQKSFLIYPNPVTGGVLNVKLQTNTRRPFNIVNMVGQNVLNGTFIKEVDVSGLIPGMYFFQIKDGSKILTRKFIKE